MEGDSDGMYEDSMEMDRTRGERGKKGRGGSEGKASTKRVHEDDEEVDKRKRVMMDDYKIIYTFKSNQDMNDISLMTLVKGLKKDIGEVEIAKVLRDGRLLIKCKNGEQKNKTMRLQKLCNKIIKEKIEVGERKGARGVVTGIPRGENLDDLKREIKGGTVTTMKRMMAFRNGEKTESESVLVQFAEEVLPERIMIGYLSFYVRAYVPPPVRCFKCQRYGHITSVCHAKMRCGRCGGEHEYGQCGENEQVKCCNCGGNHTAAYGGCIIRKQATEVQQIRVERNITYAEAVKIRNQESAEQDRSENSSRNKKQEAANTGISMDKLVVFLAYVINCTEQARNKTEKIKIIVKAAAKFLNLKELSWEQVQGELQRVDETESCYHNPTPC
ncbi:uncharacterized protein LOC133553371 [Nerophis ophidion]|uniref:uncharacterized protein LOC133553371 n=1 Tax=Nerophis ophidion TaxID=159077 RepID=UPI002ADF7BA9|nr:uncharacterized protein LOC133553371 [Nerophis ophidion]